MPDPFDLTQYVTSFEKISDYLPNPFGFTDFEDIFRAVSQALKMRQAAVTIGYGVPAESFTNVENYEATTPNGLASAITLFQDAFTELVVGNAIIDAYRILLTCTVVTSPVLGFFNTISGLPINSLTGILQGGTFTPAPDPSSITNLVQFASDIANGINEIIFGLNNIRYIHGVMEFTYPTDDTCIPCSTSPPPSTTPPSTTPPSTTPPSTTPPSTTPPSTSPPTTSPGGCFVLGTKITMADGTTKAIEDIAVGDYILSLSIPHLPSEDSKKSYFAWSTMEFCLAAALVPARVSKIFRGQEPHSYLINKKIRATYEHPFLVKTYDHEWRFVCAKDLKKGYFMYSDFGPTEIENVEHLDGIVNTANLNIEEYEVYMAEGVFVHNTVSPKTSSPGAGTAGIDFTRNQRMWLSGFSRSSNSSIGTDEI